MAFDRAQQGKFRPLVEEAWQTHARQHNLDPKNRAQKDAWYRGILLGAVGYTTTNACDKGRDFEALMWRFEEIADNGSTYWQNRAENGDLRRICFAVFGKSSKWEINGTPITAAYLSGIARQALHLDHLPALRTLSKDALKDVIRFLAIHRRRHSTTAN